MIYSIKRFSRIIEEKLFGKSNEPIRIVPRCIYGNN